MYFPNGMSGMDFMERHCERCVNWRDKGDGRGAGCAVMDAHMLHNGDQFKNAEVKSLLDTLIPGECSMRLTREELGIKACRRNGCSQSAKPGADYCEGCGG